MMIQVLKQTPVGQIVSVDLDDRKLAVARELGAHHTFNAASTDVPAALRTLTERPRRRRGVRVRGIEATVRAAILSARKGATRHAVGNLAPNVSLPLQSVVTRQIRLQGSCASSGEYPECLELIASGKVNVDRFISAAVPLEEGAEWFDRLYKHEPGLMKVLLKP